VSAKDFRGRLLGLLAKLELVAAVLFLAVLTMVAAFYVAGALNRESAGAIWGLLRGKQVAMTPADRRDLAELKRQAEARSEVDKREQEASGQARQEVEKRKEQLLAEFKREHEFLKLLSDQLLADRRKLGEEGRQLADGQKKLTEAQDLFQKEKDKTRLAKVLKLYQGMDAEIIAGDFEKRLKTTDSDKAPKFKEVVEILRQMPERQASEVLSAMLDADTRNSLMEALREKKS